VVAGHGLAICGGAAIALGNGGVASADLTGLALCLVAGFSYAVYTLTAKSLSTHASPARASLWVFGTAAVIALPAAWLIAPSGGADLVAAGSRGWLVVAWLGVVATGVSYLLFSSALRFISAATGVALALGEPLTAFTLAVLLLGEPLRASGLAGIALILAGLALVIRSSADNAGLMARQSSLLIIGCGDVGLRVVRALGGRLRVFALTSSPARCDALRAAGVRPLVGDLDDPATLGRLAGLADAVLYLAPPPTSGHTDPRLRALLHALSRRTRPARVVYASTTGVYGDCRASG
jgi:uncharacterized membrane protein